MTFDIQIGYHCTIGKESEWRMTCVLLIHIQSESVPISVEVARIRMLLPISYIIPRSISLMETNFKVTHQNGIDVFLIVNHPFCKLFQVIG